MNETNEIIEVKKMSKCQILKAKMQQKIMHVLMVSMVLVTMGVGNAAALNNTSFQGVTETIEAIIPIFGALQNLVVAIVPYILTLALIGGLVALIKGLFNKGMKF